ncbi:MAG: xanthine/uracil permease [Psychroserpens sp.]|jgi:xanthine/uracil permease
MATNYSNQNSITQKRLPLLLIIVLCFVATTMVRGQFIQEDKMLHFGVGTVIGAGTTGVVYGITKNKTKAVIWGIGLSTLAGITKEVIDHNSYGKADTGDMVATTLGGVFGSFSVTIILDKKRKRR